ncbi:hypothetical protein DSO57_1028224 [Entomophthora muscae]|uniref:Uncharacterized protein n=2 Tax=Entomophthora muscae TaxID=34485 RepID=A0ACC2SQH1_9FUNG|nr:hypothetical protein DSO57_1021138 [Entomophthora muscae]KAJ9064644.1 hypothetical protein DSO57_1028224 [Entomophthora muscae]
MQFSTIATLFFASAIASQATNTTNATAPVNGTNSTGSGNSTTSKSNDAAMLGSKVILAVAAAIAGSL